MIDTNSIAVIKVSLRCSGWYEAGRWPDGSVFLQSLNGRGPI